MLPLNILQRPCETLPQADSANVMLKTIKFNYTIFSVCYINLRYLNRTKENFRIKV